MMPFVVVQCISFWSPEGKKDLEDLFTSLQHVDYPRDRWQIVVVDNPSVHGRAAEYLKERWLPQADVTLPKITLIESQKNDGFSGGHTRGFETSRNPSAEYVYLINQDATVEPTFLWRAMQAAEGKENCAIIQSRIMLKEKPDLLNSCGNALHFLGFGFCLGYKQRVDAFLPNRPIFFASGAGLLLRTSIIEKIGGLFDPSYFMYHEDVDVSWRARLAGYEICYASDSIIYHRYEFSRSIKKFYWMERNRHLTNLVNYKLATLLLIAPAAIIMELGTLWFAYMSGWAGEKIKSWLFFAKPTTWIFIMRHRALIRRLRVATDRQMLAHMVGAITNQEVQNPLLGNIVNPCLQLYFILLKFLVRW